MLSCGIVGLPNVGKSTLFNALLKKQLAFVANYPFATIEPNIGIVPVMDNRLKILAEIEKNEEKMDNFPPIIYSTVRFVDIAGLIGGASTGAGLGNKFLSHIREVNAIAHVVRVFEDENILKEGSEDPLSDYNTIQTELILSDIKKLEYLLSNTKALNTHTGLKKETVHYLFSQLNQGIPARLLKLNDEEKESIQQLFLLSIKPELIVLNVSEDVFEDSQRLKGIIPKYANLFKLEEKKFVVICAKFESMLSELSEIEQQEYSKSYGIQESAIDRFINISYDLLNLISFLTTGVKEVRSWTIENGINAQNASGVIHTDFIKNFIKAEVISFNHLVEEGGWKKAEKNGQIHFEGRDYIIKDGDVIEFKIGR